VPEARVRAASGTERIALTSASGLTLVTADTEVSVDVSVDAAVFVGDLLVVTVPESDRHRTLLLDPRTGRVLDEAFVDADDAVAFLTPHPTEPVVMVELAMGQDGSQLFRVDVDGTSLRIAEVLQGEEPVFAGFHPHGDRMLIAPHPNDPECLRVFSWPSLDEVARLTAGEIDAEQGFGLAACWVDDDRIAAYATADALIIVDAELQKPQRVELPIDLREEGEVESLIPLTSGRIAAGIWTAAGRLTLTLEVVDD
jgi:hypothetical protein